MPEGRLRAGDHRAADRRREQRRARSRSRPPSRRRLAGIRVYTIGFGTEDPGGRPPRCGAQYIGNEPGDSGAHGFDPGFGGGGFGGGGGGLRRAIDEETLMAVAEATGGEYYPAENAEQLNEVFAQLPTDLIVSHEVVEISVVFTAVAVVLIAPRDPARAGLAAVAVG